MTHLPFIIAAFSVFVLVLAADALGSWLRLRNAKRLALRRHERLRAREASTSAANSDVAPGSARLSEPGATGVPELTR